jgi:hypothetical protein
METRTCRMKRSLGEIEACPGARCPFWEDGSCAFRNLSLQGQPELAEFLLGLRGELERARAEEDADAARHRFYERMNAGRSD